MDESVEITEEMLIAELTPEALIETFDPKKEYSSEELDRFADAELSKNRREEDAVVGKVGRQILLYLKDHRFGHVREIAASRGVSDSAVRRNLPPLIERGWVSKAHKEDGAQHYKLVEGADLPHWIALPKYLSNIEHRERLTKEVFAMSDKAIDPANNSGLYKRVWVPKNA